MFNQTSITADVLKGYMASKPKKQFTGVSPSSLGGCMRSHFYKLKGIEETTPPNYGALVNFQIGFIVEEFLAKAYKEQGKLVKWLQDGVEKPWRIDQLNLVGLPDIIALNKDDEPVIVDSKTMRSEWFQYAKRYKTFDAFVKDNEAYIYQQVCYILLARANGYPKMRKAVLSFFSKDDGYVGNEIEITITTDLANLVIDRIKLLNGYLDRDEVPPCECEGWKINYCPMGNPYTKFFNKKGKEVASECCSTTIWDAHLKGEVPYARNN